jgi:hypothetical protein
MTVFGEGAVICVAVPAILNYMRTVLFGLYSLLDVPGSFQLIIILNTYTTLRCVVMWSCGHVVYIPGPFSRTIRILSCTIIGILGPFAYLGTVHQS